MRKNLFISLLLLVAITTGSFLIWHGFNLDKQSLQDESLKQEIENKVLGQQTDRALPSPVPPPSVSASASANTKYKVVKVFDGDTFQIKLNDQAISVRLIGIDTPETVDPRRPVGCFGKKASDETKRLLEGKEVIMTKDVSDKDKYNRLLRYVYLPLSGGETLFVNDYLVRQGFAKNYTYPPDVKYSDRFLAAEREARENLRGLWSECK